MLSRLVHGVWRARELLWAMRGDQLALAAGVSTRAIHQIENGKPTESPGNESSPCSRRLDLKFRVE